MKSLGWLLVTACTMFLGCATAATKPPIVDVTGTWAGKWVGTVGSGPVTMTLQQTGGNVAGDLVMGGGSPFSGPLRGTVSGDEFSFSYRGGTGDFTVKGNEMSGSTRVTRWILKRQ
jgi:hypothetical protein